LGSATVNGNDGNDRLFVWHQKNVDYDGGSGSDTIEFSWNIGFYDNPTAGATVDLTAGTGTNPWGGTLILANVENVIGEFGHDNDLRGDAAPNYLQGGTAVDHLRGEGGNDTIYVKYWSKPFDQSARGTVADGGTGTDTLVAELSDGTAAPFTGSGPTYIVWNVLDLLLPAQDTGTFSGGTFDHFEVFQASNFDPTIRFDFRGSNLGEVATGGSGPDLLSGRGGNDLLAAGAGNDLLTGGIGRDRLAGGTGLDKFDFNAISESLVGVNHDTIVDFNRAQHDRIDLSTIDADQRAGHPGNQAFVFIGATTFAHYHALHPAVFAMVRSAGALVQGNVNASLAADFEIKVNLPAMLHGDFVL
jgi:Ca2+-binding RTX toxin-like protein